MEINRYPSTRNKSLKAWNAADEYILTYLEEQLANNKSESNITIYNDRFGYLTSHLRDKNPIVVTNAYSQQKSIVENLNRSTGGEELRFVNPMEDIKFKTEYAIINIPKSVDLLEQYLLQITQSCTEGCLVICGFMTKYFSKKALSVCTDYFEVVEQTKAKKKSRLILLSKPKKVINRELLRTISYQLPSTDSPREFQQYYGVFSSKHIDYATQFLLEHIRLDDIKTTDKEMEVLDVGCGNGIIASYIQLIKPICQLSIVDDSYLAIESARLNLDTKNIVIEYNDGLDPFKEGQFDVIVSNPPFHFEYETNIEITIGLFQGAHRCLKLDGKMIIVANRHLNYSTHLEPIFERVDILASNDKYEVIECWK